MKSKRFKIVTVAMAAVLSLLALTACTGGAGSKAQNEGQKLTEEAFDQQSKAVPYPKEQLKGSAERQNIREKLLRTENKTLLGYVYIMNYGKIVGYYSVKGKVSSNASQMTTDQLIVRKCNNSGDCTWGTVNAPGDDGSYGPNEDGIFFFTTEGAYVSTNLDYVWSDQPLPIDVPRLNAPAGAKAKQLAE